MNIASIIRKWVLAPFGSEGSQVPNNDIPLELGGIPNQFSWRQGIPLITAQPVKEDGTGGIPSRAGDHGGLHNVWSTTQFNSQFGILPNEYNERIQTDPNFGGYPRGAIVIYPSGDSVNKAVYQSLVDNNTFVPTDNTTWVKLFALRSSLNAFPRFPDWSTVQYLVGSESSVATWTANTTLTIPFDCWCYFYTDRNAKTTIKITYGNKTNVFEFGQGEDDNRSAMFPLRANTTLVQGLENTNYAYTRIFCVGMEDFE
ncbi:hypothetical protein IKF15_00410 [Candidatus Saccharibacteria bacterium]|nr:hypothetical protein [Candidatus Saccharibacteria bacterium]